MRLVKELSSFLKLDLIRSAGTYGFFSMINNAIPFFLLPVMTRYLSPEEYGYVSIFMILLTLAVPIVGINFSGAYSRAYFAKDRFESPVYFGTIVLATAVSGVLFTVLVGALRIPLASLFSFPASWLWLVPIAASAKCINDIILVHWQVRKKPIQFGMFINFRTVIQATMAILLVIVVNLNWQGQVYSMVLAPLISAPIGLLIMTFNSGIKFSFYMDYLKHAFLFGLPLIPHTLAGFLNSSINRIFISKMIGVAEAGLYTVGFQVGAVILLFAIAFNQAYTPWLFERLNKGSPKLNIRIVKITYIYFILILFFSLMFALFAPWLLSFFVGKSFQAANLYIIWIALGFAFTGMYFMVVNYLFYVEKTYYLSIITVIMSLINIFLNYFFIKTRGSIGAAQATTIVSFFTFIIVWYVASKVYKMPWNIFKILK